GPGRLIAGVGAGAYREPFEATRIPFSRRVQALTETVEILRRTWRNEPASYAGELFAFDDVAIDPSPGPDTPIWIGGSTPAAVRRARDLGDGWLPGRCPLKTFDEHRRFLLASRASFGIGLMPV